MDEEKTEELESGNDKHLCSLFPCGEKSNVFKMLSEATKEKTVKGMYDYLKSIAADLGEDRSFYTTDFADVLRKYQQWQQKLPRVKMFYAVKANRDPKLLQFLRILGTSFDCATEGEVKAVLEAGCTPDRIIFANPNPTIRGLKYIQKMGVDLMTFDSEGPLRRIHQIFPTVRLLLRLRPMNVKCSFDFSEKFGCSLEEAQSLLNTAKVLGMNVTGVSFHVGSLNTEATAFVSAIKNARHVFDIGRSLGFQFSILDIGGGFLGSTGTEIHFKKIAQRIREALDANFPRYNVQVIAEPGCYVICSAVTLTTTIFSKKRDQDSASNHDRERQYFLNSSVYSSFAPGIEEYNVDLQPLLNLQELKSRPYFISSLFGQSLCSRDILRRNILLPDMAVGENIVWKNVGAYSQVLCSTFCGFPLPASKYVFSLDSRFEAESIKNLDEITNFVLECEHVVNEDCKKINHSLNGKPNSKL